VKLSLAAVTLVALAPGPAAGAANEAAESSLSVQAGWWSLESEWKGRRGLYAAVGIPWVLVPTAEGSGLPLPFAARVGYQLDSDAPWKVRVALHVAGLSQAASCACGERESHSFAFAELGLRYEGPSGLVAGLDLPLAAVYRARTPGEGLGQRPQFFPAPISFVFAQLYLGHAWRF
jgi:hypothetical protein